MTSSIQKPCIWTIITLCAAIAGFGSPLWAGTPITLSFGHIHNPGHDQANAADRFKELVEQRTGGRIAISIFPSSQMGTAREMMEQCVMGTLDITSAGASDWATSLNLPELAAFELPFLYKNLTAQKKLIDELLVKEAPKILSGTGLRHLMTYANGIRNPILKTKPIYRLEDLKGVKMRCPETALYVELWKSLGCNTVTAPWSEVYSVVSQGVADAAEADAVGIVNMNLQEVGKYYSRVSQMGSVYVVCMNENVWTSLPKDLQQILAECAKENERTQMANRQASDDAAELAIANAGVKMNELADGERARMRLAVKHIHDDFAKKYNRRDLVDALLALDE